MPVTTTSYDSSLESDGFAKQLAARGARIEQCGPGAAFRRVADFGSVMREFAAAMDGAVCCPLLDWTAIAVGGADATTFLQGQFTNDVAGLEIGATQWNGWCSPKGRLLANFVLGRTGPDDYRLLVPADLAAGIVRRLRMFVLRSKVTAMSLDEAVCVGIHGGRAGFPGAGRLLERDGCLLVGYPDGRVVAICASAEAAVLWEQLAAGVTPAGSPVWDWLAIRAGLPVVTAATQDRFVPQMLLWELHGVSFRKGCYPGQEIVARMQYRGKPKERLYRGRVDALAPAAGASLFSSRFGGQACGTVVNAVDVPGTGAELLAVIQIASANADRVTLQAGGNGPALELLSLPYAVPASGQDEAR